MSRFNSINIRTGLVQGFYWMASCVFVSFLVRLLRGFGYSDYECGIALSVSAAATLSVQPLLGKAADRVKRVSLLIAFCFALSSLFALLLIPFHSNRILTYFLIFLIFGFFRSLIYVIDLWSFAAGEGKSGFSYGFSRSFGAVFYALSAPVYGMAIDSYGTRIIIPLFVVMSALSAFMVMSVPLPDQGGKTQKEKTGTGSSMRMLLKNRNYIVLLVAYTLTEMSAIPEQNYLTRKFEILGCSEIYTGISLFVMGMLQIPVLNCMDRISRKVKPHALIAVSVFGILLRNIIIAFSRTGAGTVAAFLTEPFAFGLYIGAFMLYMHEYVPSSVIYFGTTLYSAFTSGIGGMAGNYLAGLLSEKLGLISTLRIMVLPSLLGFIIYFVLVCVRHDEKKRD